MKCPICNSSNIKYVMEGTFRIISDEPDYPELNELRYGNIHDVADTFKNYKVVGYICCDCEHSWNS